MSVTDPVTPVLFPLGQDGILVRFGDGFAPNPEKALACGATVRAAGLAGVAEVATSLASVYVRFDPARVTRGALADRLRNLIALPRSPSPTEGTRLWEVPASFGGDTGPQLAEAASLAGLSPDAAVAEIAATELSVLAIGFAPGQPYLGHLPDGWNMPRQTALTPQVPAGALVVALRQIVLFANPSPTGWRWIGTCGFQPFSATRSDPFALRAGDRVRLVPTDAATVAALAARDDGLGGATCTVTP